MNKKILLIALFTFFASYFTVAQDLKMCGYLGYQTIEEVTSACDLQGFESGEASTTNATQAVDEILNKLGLFRNFRIEECTDINNAIAVTMPNPEGGFERYILYDTNFFEKVSTTTGNDWGKTSILAHEVGHHLNGHTLTGQGSSHEIELQADEFAGFVLARMGCSLENAQAAISNLLPDEASSTHPAKQDRLDAVGEGWSRGYGNSFDPADFNRKRGSIMESDEYINATEEVRKLNDENAKKILENEGAISDSSMKNDITIEKLSNSEVLIKEMTPQLVLANYIEAIGGFERISKVRTLKKNSRIQQQYVEVEEEQTFLNPQTYKIVTYEPDHSMVKELTKIVKQGKVYEREAHKMSKNKRKDIQDYVFETKKLEGSYETDVSYFKEYGALISNAIINLEGAYNVQGELCFLIMMPTQETILTGVKGRISKRVQTEMGSSPIKKYETLTTYNYYIIESGLLRCSQEVKGSLYRNEAGLEKESTIKSRTTTFFGDYDTFDGIKFPKKKIELGRYISYNKTHTLDNLDINPRVSQKEFKL